MIKSLPITLRILLWPFTWLPLVVVHFMGAALGMTLAAFSQKDRALLRENLEQSGICKDPSALDKLVWANIAESGKGLLETFAVWQRSEACLLSWVKQCDGWDEVEAALAEGKGIIFLTPHLGCYEIVSLYCASHHPITVLYRPPKQAWLLPLIESGRTRGKAKLAPATTQGVRDLLLALRRKEAIGILPDQIPSTGEGEWAPFFGRPAYTMTLASKLAQKTGAAVITVFGERLPFGRGFHLHFRRQPDGCIDSVTGLNSVIETEIRRCPEQYLWSYNRHKTRNHARPGWKKKTAPKT